MTVEAEIVAFGAALDAVLVANDAATIDPFFGYEWVYIGPDGPTRKADLLDWIASGKLAHHSMRTIGAGWIVVHGDTAVASARRASTGSWEGVAYTADEWISDVYVRRYGRWVCVLSHKCPVGRETNARCGPRWPSSSQARIAEVPPGARLDQAPSTTRAIERAASA